MKNEKKKKSRTITYGFFRVIHPWLIPAIICIVDTGFNTISTYHNIIYIYIQNDYHHILAGLDECMLNCKSGNYRHFKSFKEVTDGTICGRTAGFQCKSGRCIKADVRTSISPDLSGRKLIIIVFAKSGFVFKFKI